MTPKPRKDPAMHELKQVAGKTGKRADALATLLVVALLGGGGIALAQAQRTGGPTPSGQGAEVYFIDLKDGANVPAKLKLYFGLRNMGVAPAGSDRENSGHHHLLVDTELPPLDKPIPNDFNHLHFGAGQTEAEITLKHGEHTLQLLLGDKDHIPHNPPVMSPRIKVVVAEGAAATAAAPTTMRRRKRVQTHTAPPKRVVVEQRRSRPAYRSYYPGYRSYYGYQRYRY